MDDLKTDPKRAAILDAAKSLFVDPGYNGVSMDSIAAQAGVSKLTVYSHFGDKETLFTEAVQSKCVEMLPDELFVTDVEGPLRLDEDTLKSVALRTNAEYFHAATAQDLRKVYETLSSRISVETKETEVTALLALAGAALMLLAGALSVWWFGRVL